MSGEVGLISASEITQAALVGLVTYKGDIGRCKEHRGAQKKLSNKRDNWKL